MQNIFIVILIYWLAFIPLIFIVLFFDKRRRKTTLIGFLCLITFFPILGNFIFLFSGWITYTKKDQILFTAKVSKLIKEYEISKTKIISCSSVISYKKSQCFLDGAKWMNAILTSIEKAKKEICLSFFYILQGRNRAALLKALEKKLAQGVKVYISIDGASTYFGAKNKTLLQLKNKGAIIEIIKPIWGILTSHGNNLRNHYKLVIIDGYYSFVGGANIADLYVHQKKRMGYWNDSYFGVNGFQISQTLKNVIRINAKHFENFDYINQDKKEAENNTLEIVENQPELLINKHELAIKELIKHCKSRFYIYIPYLSPPSWLINDLIKMKKRGIEVKVMIPHYADKKLVYVLTKHFAHYLKGKGVIVKLLKHTYVHSKTIICDNKVFTGTSNFDNRSFYMNYEIMFLFSEENMVKKFVQKWFYDELSCINLSEKQKLSLFEKCFLPIAMMFRTTI